jgi:hypothetical protein
MNFDFQIFNDQIHWSRRNIVMMLSENDFVCSYKQWNYRNVLRQLLLSLSFSVCRLHLTINSYVLVVVLTNWDINEIWSEEWMLEQKIYCLINISILNDHVHIEVFINFDFHDKFLLSSIIVINSRRNSIQLSQSFFLILKAEICTKEF